MILQKAKENCTMDAPFSLEATRSEAHKSVTVDFLSRLGEKYEGFLPPRAQKPYYGNK